MLLAGSLTCTLVWLAWGARWTGIGNPALLGAAVLLHGALWVTRRRDAATPTTTATALAVAAVALAATVVVPLHHSRDLYLYDIYGQAVAEHGVNPYTTAPDELDDPQLALVNDEWHGQTSMYGPAFVALAAVVSIVGNGSELAVRLSWQVVMAGAAMVALLAVARRTRDPMAVLALGCSPVLLAAVHDAHNDVLVGLGVLTVVVLVEDRRHLLAAAAAAVTIAVKLPAAVPIAAVAAWLWWRRGWRPALGFGLPMAAMVGGAYLVAGGAAALAPLRDSSGEDSRFALWQPLRHARVEEMLADGVAWRTTLETVRDQMSTAALVLTAAALLVVLWRYRRSARPGEVAGIAGLVLLVTSTYVMPWYPALVLPAVALAWRSRVSRLVQLQAGFLLVAYAQGPGNDPTTAVGVWFEERAMWINLAFLAAALVWATPSASVHDIDLSTRPSVDGMEPPPHDQQQLQLTGSQPAQGEDRR